MSSPVRCSPHLLCSSREQGQCSFTCPWLVAVGASGSVFGLIGAMLGELITNWVTSPCQSSELHAARGELVTSAMPGTAGPL
mmetsp:Transcript_13477/g.49039  ORF Transcript_13477/g.49039 Transcript_13477/m.49039 type:complete len:82 (-) Transcript_13477:17-262(-)